MQNTLQEANTLIRRLGIIEKDLEYNQCKISACEADIDLLKQKRDLILLSREYHKKAIDILYRSSIAELEFLMNEVVSAIFTENRYRVGIDLSDSRSKAISWYLINEDVDPNLKMSIRSDVGRGVRVVLSFIIQSYYILSLGSKHLFIDEGYSFLSEEYVVKFFEFVSLLCKEKGLSLVMISHDDRFTGYADKHYGVLAGKIYDGDTTDFKNFEEWNRARQKEQLLLEEKK